VGSLSRIGHRAIIVAVAASLGITGSALWRVETASNRGALVLEFDTRPFAQGILQGQIVNVPLAVRNSGTARATIRGVQLSCGCRSVLDAAGSELSVPQIVEPGGAIEWQVALSMESDADLSIAPLRVEYECDGSVFRCEAELKLHVRAGPHSMTGPIVLGPGQLEGSATIGDAFPDGGVAFRGVDVRSGVVESASLEEIPPGGGDAGADVSPCGVVPRYRLRVRGSRSARDYCGYVTLIPKDSSRQPVHITVYFRSEGHTADWQVFPSELVIPQGDGSAVTREIRVLADTGTTPDFKSFSVCTSSKSVRAVPRVSGSALIVAVTINPDLEARVEESITVRDQNGKPVSVVPILVLPKL
jgi:hypothetical protein